MTGATTIKPKERDTVLAALRAGVVPATGLHHIQVGRLKEIESLNADLMRVADGGTSFRLIVGDYGAGKSFFLSLVRSIAQQHKLVVVHSDLNPDRRLHASGGQARSLYAELMRNLSTRVKPEGGALTSVVEKFLSTAQEEAKAKSDSVDNVIANKLAALAELRNGYEFADVIKAYYDGHTNNNVQKKNDAIRWLRGEFATKTDARQALGVRGIIDDADVYDTLKLLARFFTLAGYAGLLVSIDELVNLFKMPNSQARNANYEQILRMLNDTLQGGAANIGFVLGATPQTLLDTRRGMYSYEALQSRLGTNNFARDSLVDFNSPVIKLANLSQEDFYVLLQNVRHVFAYGDPSGYLLDDDGIHAFMNHCAQCVGEAYFRTPRTSITSFIQLLSVIEQNPGTQWHDLIEKTAVERDTGGDTESDVVDDDEELRTFRL